MAKTQILLLTDFAPKATTIPSEYVRSIGERPDLLGLEEVGDSIPLIDLQELDGPNHSKIIQDIRSACENDGFFLVKNHGVPEIVIKNVLQACMDFFRLPKLERLKVYSDDPAKSVRLSTSFNVRKEKSANWRDFLRLHCYPLEEYMHQWPDNPPYFKDAVSEYCKRTRNLALKLLEAISESLGLERDYILKVMGREGQHMAMNYYPSCPEPEFTYGLQSHTDPNTITILLQDQVRGLQVLRNSRWINVDPISGTFLVNIGDQIQVISNGRYKSVQHRVVVNKRKERISVPTFYCPSPDSVIEPAKKLIDTEHPAVYRNFTYGEYYKKFWDQGLDDKPCLETFKVSNCT